VEFRRKIVPSNIRGLELNLKRIWVANKGDEAYFKMCGLVVRVPGNRSRGPGSILGATRFSEK
jgi:hypothetical protein